MDFGIRNLQERALKYHNPSRWLLHTTTQLELGRKLHISAHLEDMLVVRSIFVDGAGLFCSFPWVSGRSRYELLFLSNFWSG